MPVAQRPRTVVEQPSGLLYRADLITPEEETRLLEWIAGLDFQDVVMRGQTARRRVHHLGYRYGYESWRLVPGDPLPPWLLPLRDRCAELAGIEAGRLAQALVTRYPPGAGIGWHRDAPAFGSRVIGVSLGAACRMRFQRRAGETRHLYELTLEPRSGYVLSGPARTAWQHSIPATREQPEPALLPAPDRYSVTFRSLREQAPGTRT
jgi:alkylated DNA repair dioxygenase AlkB